MHLSLVRMADACCKLSWKITHAYGALPNKAFHYIGNMAPAYCQKGGGPNDGAGSIAFVCKICMDGPPSIPKGS